MRSGADTDWQDWYGSSIWSFGAKPIAECADTSGFGPPAESLSLVWPRESNQREGHPDIRPRLCRGSLLPVLLRGPSRRDVPVPSFLARRPCLASPCATPPLGLLTGNGVRVAWKIENLLWLFWPNAQPSGDINRPFQKGKRNRCVEGRAAGMRRES